MQDRPNDETVPPNHEIIFYSTPGGAVRVEVVFEGETFWLTQKKMADLFGIGVQTINNTFRKSINPVN